MSEEIKQEVVEETEKVPVDEKIETIHFPWFIAIIIGVLMVLIVACIIVIKVLEGWFYCKENKFSLQNIEVVISY